MRVESIDIRGFGRLTDAGLALPAGKAALIVENNESGKSTLAAAIIAGLCGFPARRIAGEKMKLAEVYRPWDGGPYALDMVLEADGHRWLVQRDFARGTFTVRDALTNRDVSAETDPDLAWHFLRLSREDYLRVALISGKEVSRFSSSASIRERLSSVVEGSRDDSGAETALAVLQGATYALDGRGVKVETALSRISKSIDEKTRRMRELDAQLDAAGEDVRLLDETRERHTAASARLAELDMEFRAARLAEVRERIASAEKTVREVNALREELAQLEDCSRFPVHRRDQLTAAAARLADLESSLSETRRQICDLSAQVSGARSRVESRKQFELAAENDLVSLSAASEAVRDAREAAAEAAAEAGREKGSRSRALGWVFASAGLAGGLAFVALMVLRVLDVVPSVVGTSVGVVLAAAGVVIASKAGAKSAGASAKAEQAQRMLSEAVDRAVRRLAMLHVDLPPGADVADLLSRTHGLLSEHLADRARLHGAQRELASAERDAAELDRRVAAEREVIRSILSEAGIDTTAPLDEALRSFSAAERRHARWREISQSLLPALESRMLPSEALAALRDEEGELATGASDAVAPARASAGVEADRQQARREAEEVMSLVRELERKVGATVDLYRREYPALRDEVAGLRAELARAERFGRSVELAASVLREVAENTRRRWAAALNERAAAILPHLNPDYDDLRFDDSLDFTVRHVPDGRIIERDEVDARLSTGAKDQLYLAVRLAICRELAGLGEPMPIILDDPLMASDDDRFAHAFRYLVEDLAREQQVIILSCHTSRHERFADEDWFRDSVEFIDLAP